MFLKLFFAVLLFGCSSKLHSFHFFRHASHSFFCVYVCSRAHLLHSQCVAVFFCSEKRNSGKKRESVATDSATAALLMPLPVLWQMPQVWESKIVNKQKTKKEPVELSSRKKYHRKMSGTLEMLPFISRNKSLSHSRVEIQLLLLLCFYLVSKIHSLCQRSLTLTYLSFEGIFGRSKVTL